MSIFRRANNLNFTGIGLVHDDGYTIASWDEIDKIRHLLSGGSVAGVRTCPARVLELIKTNQRIKAIKAYRETYQVELKPAKEFVDMIVQKLKDGEEILAI